MKLQTTIRKRSGSLPAPDIRDHARFVVVAVDPGEPAAIAIKLMQLLARAVEAVEIADERLNAAVLGILQQVPVEREHRDSIRRIARIRRP